LVFVQDPLRHREALLRAEPDCLTTLQLDHELAVENEKELVFVVVLVPLELAVEHPEPNHGVIDQTVVSVWLNHGS
jgi:hypothetical protein